MIWNRSNNNAIDFLIYVRYNVRIMSKKEAGIMNTTTITNFRKNIYGMVENTVRYNEPLSIISKTGNAVMISEEEYNNLMETLFLTSIPGMREKLIDGLHTPLDETVPEEEAGW